MQFEIEKEKTVYFNQFITNKLMIIIIIIKSIIKIIIIQTKFPSYMSEIITMFKKKRVNNLF